MTSPSESLREQLAMRLQRVAMPESVYTGSFDHWRWVADECIRQMEWARINECKRNLGLVFETDEFPPLTLAPEDWKP